MKPTVKTRVTENPIAQALDVSCQGTSFAELLMANNLSSSPAPARGAWRQDNDVRCHQGEGLCGQEPPLVRDRISHHTNRSHRLNLLRFVTVPHAYAQQEIA